MIVKEWTGKEVKFPAGLSCTSLGEDMTCLDLYSDSYKILLFVDSTGCTSCRLKLSEWKRIMLEADSAFTRSPEFIFIFQPKKQNEKEMEAILRNKGFRHLVFKDKENEIDKLNKFPSNPDYQCFLLDQDNKVVMVGNPSLNTGVRVLYKRIITESETAESTRKCNFLD